MLDQFSGGTPVILGLLMLGTLRLRSAQSAAAPRSELILVNMAAFRLESINYLGIEIVALGTPIEIRAAQWTTPDGKVPAEYQGREDEVNPETDLRLVTPVILEVKEYWKNPQPRDRLIVETLGGRDGDYEQRYGYPSLKDHLGQEMLVFLGSSVQLTGLGAAWQQSWIVPVENGRMNWAPPCAPRDQIRSVPIEEMKVQMLAVLAAGTPYDIEFVCPQARSSP